MKKAIRRLEHKIDRIINSPQGINSTLVLKETRSRLNHLYAKEEKYWSQISRSLWLKKGKKKLVTSMRELLVD